MAARGRKPIPPELRILKGMRADRSNVAAPRAVAGEPEPPADLDDAARVVWDRLVADLRRLGTLSRTDGDALALYCRLHGRMLAAEADIAAHGLRESTNGGDKANPAVGLADRAIRQMVVLLAEFGLTPASRNRVKDATRTAEDRLGTFLAQKRKEG